MQFADFHAGQVIEAGPYVLTEAELVQFARAYDPQWFHTDAEAAAQSPFGGLIASGWQTCAIAMRLVVDAVLAGSESFASPGLEQVRWPNPVRPGDTLRLVADVSEVRRSEKRPTLGILRWRWRLFNQREQLVLEVDVTSMFKLKPAP
ncbi:MULTISPECIES: MaoC family dehydratase [unclassified Variovorax]|uniref:MaoC family dehydratase n=1 Tax=unclassified Variovorax TaxID=663243 RepID=UPI003F47A080